jgi:hypothetical protein
MTPPPLLSCCKTGFIVVGISRADFTRQESHIYGTKSLDTGLGPMTVHGKLCPDFGFVIITGVQGFAFRPLKLGEP